MAKTTTASMIEIRHKLNGDSDLKAPKSGEFVVAVRASDLFVEPGLYYLWARGNRRPCIMLCGHCGPNGILMFTTAAAARRYLDTLADYRPSIRVGDWPIRFVHLTNLPWFFKKWKKLRKVIVPRLSDCAHQVFETRDLVQLSRSIIAACAESAA